MKYTALYVPGPHDRSNGSFEVYDDREAAVKAAQDHARRSDGAGTWHVAEIQEGYVKSVERVEAVTP